MFSKLSTLRAQHTASKIALFHAIKLEASEDEILYKKIIVAKAHDALIDELASLGIHLSQAHSYVADEVIRKLCK